MPTEPLRLLAVFPHPDDETLGMGASLAWHADQGIECHLICATRGQRGWSGPADENPGLEELGRIREAELRCATAHLGLSDVVVLDYVDGDLDRASPRAVIAELAGHIRRIRPQVVVTYAPDGLYGQPDHVALSQFTAAALMAAADANDALPGGAPAFAVSKFYYVVDTTTVVKRVHALLGGIGMEIDGVTRSHVGWEEWTVNARIDGRATFDRVWPAILCHKTQLPGFGPITELPRDTLLEVFGEGTFVRVFSRVNGGRAVEHDLFEGLRNDERRRTNDEG